MTEVHIVTEFLDPGSRIFGVFTSHRKAVHEIRALRERETARMNANLPHDWLARFTLTTWQLDEPLY